MIFDAEQLCYCKNCARTEDKSAVNFAGGLAVALFFSGEGEMIEGANLPVAVSAGSICAAKTPCTLLCAEGAQVLYCTVSGNAAAQFCKRLAAPCTGAVARLHGCMDEMLFLENSDGQTPYAVSAHSYALLCMLTDILTVQDKNYPPLINSAIAAINRNFAEIYGIEELSASLGVSKSHLVRVFHKTIGVTPGQYLAETRVNAAKQLLLCRNYSLEVVASLTGFSGANYLCKVFKKYTGETPQQFRKKHGVDLPLEGDATFLENNLFL